MTKVKLVDGSIINAESVELVKGILEISTTEKTVEELAEMFSNKENTNVITLMTESEIESGIQLGFTSFAGIGYEPDGTKTVKMFQPADVTEARISNAEAVANLAKETANSATENANQATENANLAKETANQAVAENAELEAVIDALLGLEE